MPGRSDSDGAAVADAPPAAKPLSGADARTVRLAAPSLHGVVRFVLILVACGIALYLLWRVRGVVRLVAISLFLGLALLPVVDAVCNRDPRCLGRWRSSAFTWS